MGKASRDKGKRGELAAAKVLDKLFPAYAPFTRTSRGVHQAEADLIGLSAHGSKLTAEVKTHNTMTAKQIIQWWTDTPARTLIVKADRQPWLLMTEEQVGPEFWDLCAENNVLVVK